MSSSEGKAQADTGALRASAMLKNARTTTDFLKSLSHPTRLMILCRLAEGPASVGELEAMLRIPQAAVSKQLARLRREQLVQFERNGRVLTYSLKEDRTSRVIATLYAEFCS